MSYSSDFFVEQALLLHDSYSIIDMAVVPESESEVAYIFMHPFYIYTFNKKDGSVQ
jgi:hypothetical protein